MKLNLIITALAVCFTIISCKKKDDPQPTPTPVATTGTLYLHIHTNIDTAEVDSAIIATDATGRRFQLDLAQFYVSGIKLKKADGSYYTIPNAFILKKINMEMYLAGAVPVGTYTGIAFNVGLDSATNQTNPATYQAASPLYTQQPSMWFGSTSQGYIFMNVQGFADTSATNTGTVNYPFSFQLGTINLLRTVTLPATTITIAAGQDEMVHIIADYGKLLQGINFKTQNVATPFNNLTTATQVTNNIPLMFQYE